MKLPQNKNNLTFSYNTIDIKEALTKFSNLLILFPYHPRKSKIENIGWLTPQKFFRTSDIPKRPFCGIIEILHRKGFPLFNDSAVNFHPVIELLEIIISFISLTSLYSISEFISNPEPNDLFLIKLP